MQTDHLDAAVRSLAGAGPFAFCGVAVSQAGQRSFHIGTAPGIDATAQSYWRAASISKLVVGRVARAVFGDGLQTVEDVLGLPFRGPGAPPTVSQIASHQAGLTDAGGYLVPPGVGLRDWLARQGSAIWSGAAPGAQFEYSNLGYLILAACAEARTGQDLQALARTHLLEAAGIEAGFNWVGVAADVAVLSTYRRGADGLLAQIDAPRKDADLAGYVPGQSTAMLSPQGGLRLSLEGALRLAETLPMHPGDALWPGDPARTVGASDVFGAYGWGLQIFDAPVFYPRRLRGHFASAYGMAGGVWWDAEADMAFALVLNGLPEDDPDSDDFRPEERALLAAIAQVP